MNLPELLNHRDQISAEIFRQTGDATVVSLVSSAKLTKTGKVRKPSANKGKPTARGDFTKKIGLENVDDLTAYKEANPDQKSAHLSWYANYMREHKDEYEAFKTTWALEHPKEARSDAESVAAEGAEAAEAKPKKVLSPEHLAKMKAGREAKLVEKKAAKDQLEADAKANVSISLAPVLAAEPAPLLVPVVVAAKLKQPKKVAKKVAAVPVAPLVLVAPLVAEEAGAEELPFKHNGVTYIRIGVAKSDGNHEWSSADLWHSKKGARVSYAGELMETGEINEDAEEPNLV